MSASLAPARRGERWSRTFPLTDVHRDLGLYCAGAGRSTGSAGTVEGRTLPCHGAVLVEEGTGWFESSRSGLRRRIEGPTLLWLFPGIVHAYGSSGPAWIENWVLFGGTAARSYEQLGYLSPEACVQDLPRPHSAVDTFSRLLERCTDRSPQRAAEASALLHRLITETGAARIEAAARAPSLVDRLRAQACSTLSVHEHARRLEVSVDELRSAVRAAGIDGPKELVLQARLARARTLLAESALPVAAVAREVGYEDPAYFSRLFTRRVGTAPSRYRRRYRGFAGRVTGAGSASADPAPAPGLRSSPPAAP